MTCVRFRFFLNFFATPSSIVNDHLAMWKQYMVVFDNALGNYRKLSLRMFNDEALRKSLDQVGAGCCQADPDSERETKPTAG